MKKRTIIVCIAIAGLLCACTVKQDMYFKIDGAGKADLRIELEDAFMNYLFDMAEATSDIASPEELEVFNTGEIKASLEEQPGVTVTKILSPTQNSLELTLICSDIGNFSTALAGNTPHPLFSFTDSGKTKEFAFYLDKQNYKEIKKLFPLLENPLFENLEPRVDEKVSRAEYLDIIEFAMEEAGREAVQRGFVEVRLRVEGTIISQQGGKLQDGKILVRIPLLNLLLLNEPVRFSMRYQ